MAETLERVGVDGLSEWLGIRWDSPQRARIEVRPELINPAGLLSGGVTYALVDYVMGSALWAQRNSGERIATIGIAINYVQTAREGEIACEARVRRRNDRVAVLEAEVHDAEGRLLADAIGSFSIFPRERLGEHDRGSHREI